MGVKNNRNLERLKSNINLHNAPLCKNCPARLYQPEYLNILYGKGNMFPKVIFVLPKQAIMSSIYEELLEEVCKDIINIDEQYITYHEKCLSDKDCADYCVHYLFHEIRIRNPKKIILFGVNIPEILIKYSFKYQIYKFYDLYSIIHDSKNKDIIRNKLKQIL